MKTGLWKNILSLGAALVLGSVPVSGAPDSGQEGGAKTGKKMQEYTGTVSAVDPLERTIQIRKFFTKKTFNLAEKCGFTVGLNGEATLDDMTADMEVIVSYQEADGVLVATHVGQRSHSITGYIKAVVPARREIIMEKFGFAQKFKVTEDTKLLSHKKEIAFYELKAGQKVTLTYTKQDQFSIAHKVENKAESLSGTVEAIDAPSETIRVKSMLTSYKFHLGDGCRIVLDGNTEGKMRDLRIGERVTVDYEELKGIMVASRIELGGDEGGILNNEDTSVR